MEAKVVKVEDTESGRRSSKYNRSFRWTWWRKRIMDACYWRRWKIVVVDAEEAVYIPVVKVKDLEGITEGGRLTKRITKQYKWKT